MNLESGVGQRKHSSVENKIKLFIFDFETLLSLKFLFVTNSS